MTTSLRARLDGKALIPLDPVDLPVGAELDVEVRQRPTPPRGSPAALLRAMNTPPRLQAGDAKALERAIGEGKQPARTGGAFEGAAGE